MELRADERIDEINEYLRLIQKKDGLTFTSDAYLLAAFVSGFHPRCADLGAGTGVVSLLCAQKGKAKTVAAIERQSEFAELIARNAELNFLSERITAICGDVREIGREDIGGAVDAVFANPPYFRAGAGLSAKSAIMHDARFEEHGTFSDFALCAARLLRGGGSFYVVHRADRVTDVLCGMRGAGIEPKRMIMVFPDEKSAPNHIVEQQPPFRDELDIMTGRKRRGQQIAGRIVEQQKLGRVSPKVFRNLQFFHIPLHTFAVIDRFHKHPPENKTGSLAETSGFVNMYKKENHFLEQERDICHHSEITSFI